MRIFVYFSENSPANLAKSMTFAFTTCNNIVFYVQVMQNRESSMRISTQITVRFEQLYLLLYTCLKFKFIEFLRFLFIFFQPYSENFENFENSSFVMYNQQ